MFVGFVEMRLQAGFAPVDRAEVSRSTLGRVFLGQGPLPGNITGRWFQFENARPAFGQEHAHGRPCQNRRCFQNPKSSQDPSGLCCRTSFRGVISGVSRVGFRGLIRVGFRGVSRRKSPFVTTIKNGGGIRRHNSRNDNPCPGHVDRYFANPYRPAQQPVTTGCSGVDGNLL